MLPWFSSPRHSVRHASLKFASIQSVSRPSSPVRELVIERRRQERLFLTAIGACRHADLDGIIFQYADGCREGVVLETHSEGNPLRRDLMEKVPWTWHDVEFGDYVCEVRGFHLKASNCLCHTLEFKFHSGRTLKFEGPPERMRGEVFAYDIPHRCLPFMLSFQRGQCKGVVGLRTSIHLPLSCSNAAYFPYKQRLLGLLLVAQRLDANMQAHGGSVLGRDVWWHILGFLRGLDLNPYTPKAHQRSYEGENSRNWQMDYF